MALKDPSLHEKTARLEKARDRFTPLLEDPRRWENECEAVFSEFRVACVHLRRDSEALDSVEQKEVVWRFLCKLSRERRPFWGRCEEVLQILMHSDAWMKAFVDEGMNLNDLPTNVIKDFGARVEEVVGPPQKHVRLLLIGCGATAQKHCAAIAKYNERIRADFFQVVGLIDDRQHLAALLGSPEAVKLNLASCPMGPTPEALLSKFDFDAVVITTHLHREQTISAVLSMQRFVLAEPPLVQSLEAAARLVSQSRRLPRQQLLLIADPTEYRADLRLAAEHLSAGAVGGITAAQGTATACGPEALEVLSQGLGCSWVPGTQSVRALQKLLGPIEQVIGAHLPGQGEVSIPPVPEVSASCLFRHCGGLVSSLQLCLGGPELTRRRPPLVVSGALGELTLEETGVRVSPDAQVPRQSLPVRSVSETSRKGEEVLAPLDSLWDLFAKQVQVIARENGAKQQVAQEPAPREVFENVDQHLADLAVVQALQASFSSQHFEPVRADLRQR